MGDFTQQFAEAAEHLRPVDWSAARSESVRQALHQRRRRFTLSHVALASAAVAVVVAVGIAWFAHSPGVRASEVQEPGVAQGQIELRDGTRAIELGMASVVRLVQEDTSLVAFELESGKGWFEVTPSATRRVRVVAKDVQVEVLGTEFVVEVEGDFVHVWVHRGRVQVSSEEGRVVLEKGDNRRFRSRNRQPVSDAYESDAGVTEEASENSAASVPEPMPEPPVRSRVPEVEDEVPDPATLAPVVIAAEPDDVTLLWTRADQGRKHGDYNKAITALTILVNEHGDDARAALAAFSLGRVLVDAGQSSKAAARAFAKARKLSPEGPLVEDALLREIEAWHEAGDARRVKKRSEKYRRLFPQGRYLKQIRLLEEQP